MNPKAEAYMLKHGKLLMIGGEEELMLPLDKIQGFLDLLQPDDVPPEKLQKLYRYQAEMVSEMKRQLAEKGLLDGPPPSDAP